MSSSVVQGSDVKIEWTIDDGNGNPLDLSAASEIIYAAYVVAAQDETSVITKKMSLSEIEFVNGGSDGKINVIIQPSDTTGIDPDDYEHQIRATVGSKERVTVAETLTILPAGDFTIL